jgi:hypothetical protein
MEAEMNPVFNYVSHHRMKCWSQEHLSFIWNYFDEQSRAYSWLLRFQDIETEEKFQEGIMRALWERLNQQRWIKSKDDEREYVLQAFQGDVEMPDQSDDEDDQEEADNRRGISIHSIDWQKESGSESYDEDEEYDAKDRQPESDAKNSGLAVGYKSDRSFVVRGDRIGVFKHTDHDSLGKSPRAFGHR